MNEAEKSHSTKYLHQHCMDRFLHWLSIIMLMGKGLRHSDHLDFVLFPHRRTSTARHIRACAGRAGRNRWRGAKGVEERRLPCEPRKPTPLSRPTTHTIRAWISWM